MSRVDKAVEIFASGRNCSQAVFGAYCEKYGVDVETAYKISSGFGGGMHLGSTCGAVTRAFMVLGLKYGVDGVKPYDKTAEFAEKFCKRNDSIQCTDLMGVDLQTVEGMEEARSKGLFQSVCAEMVKDAAEILEEMGI